MANLTLKSESQILGSMARTVLAKTGLNDLNPGSILLTLLQAAAQEDFAQYYQMLQIIRNYNLDTTTGTDLDNRAFEYGLTRVQPVASTGLINILRPSSFVKIATSFYTGTRSSIAGDTVIYVNDASKFPSTGAAQTLIIGRGTPNEEEVNYTPSGSNPTDNINYYTIILATPLINDHSLQETIILKQGSDITVPSGTLVQVPASGITPQINFSTTVDATILAGESEIDNVNVQCTQPGTIGNIAVNAITGITAFPNPPFTGAQAVNLTAFTNGQDKETDTALRNRIRGYIQGLSQSTTAGITYAISGLIDPTTAKRVVSSNIILPDNVGLPVKIYIDDGTGFEPNFGQEGSEVLVASALGGESRLQTDYFPIVKAQVETLTQAPYDMSSGDLTLSVTVGNLSETITFTTNDFAIPSAATAYEIVKVINAQATLIEARTADVGSYVVLNGIADTNENITVTGGSANAHLGFPTNEVQTFYLYKNDKLLSKDGQTAFVQSVSEPFNFSSGTVTLSVTVDGKTANTQTVTFQVSDFSSPSAAAVATADQIAAIINSQLAGATASSVNGKVQITSNTLLSSSSMIKINTSSANSILGFSTSAVTGADSDYTLNQELGIIQLTNPLVVNDMVTAGTRNTRGFLTASVAQNYTFVGGETLIITVDSGSPQTITFSAASNQTAAQVAATINTSLVGGTAVTRTEGSATYLEIRTNTYNPSLGSIYISSSSTANSILGFTAGVTVSSILPHTASVVSGSAGPYTFIEGDTLVVVMDNNNSGETFVTTMDYPGVVSSGSSSTVFGSGGLIPIFTLSNELAGFWVVFKTGANTASGAIASVTNPTGNTFQYNFSGTGPANYGIFAAGDQVSFSGMNQATNDGNFLITGVPTTGTVHSPVISNTISNPSTLTPSTGNRYLVAAAANTATASSVIDLNQTNPGLSAEVNISIASPALFTTSAVFHHLNTNDPIIFNTTGALPTGLTPGTTYYVSTHGLTPTTFEVSASIGGSSINTSGTQSGSHTYESTTYISPTTGDQHIIAAGAGTTSSLTIQGRYTDSANSSVEEVNGYSYIVNGTGSDAWLGHDNQIATYNGIGTPGWVFTTPSDGQIVLDASEGAYYVFSASVGGWVYNAWAAKAGKVATWTGAYWAFTTPADKEVRNVTGLSKKYQYSVSSNTWTENDWGGQANDILQWNGSSWVADAGPSNNDTVYVTSASTTYQYSTTSTSWAPFVYYVQVTNAAGVTETATSAGSGLLGQRRQVLSYNATSGAITLTSALHTSPSVYDTFKVLPGTATNVVNYLDNTKITSLSNYAYIELVDAGTKIQLSSQNNGSDGYVQVTGGKANNQLEFSNSSYQGLQAYTYYTGLIKLVSDTIYGDETNLTTYPGVGAAGVKYQVLPPTVNEVSFVINVTLSASTTLSNVQNDLITKVISYVNSLGVSSEVILSNVVENLLQVEGVIDVSISSPSANVSVGQNELARTKASLISINTVS